jgi:type IV pilus assembly protein PilM
MAQLSVGLDIGTSAVRAAELDLGHGTPRLITYGQVGLPPGTVVDGEVVNQLAVTDAITKLWKNGGFSGRVVTVGLAGLRAITREIDIQYIPDAEVESAVRFQSEEVIPFPPDQTILSSQILADFTDASGRKMRRVLVAAAHVQLVDGIIAAVEAAGLEIRGVDLVSSALVRSVGDHGSAERPEAIISIGAGLTIVAIHQQGRPQFVRTVGSGGNDTTAAISATLDIPLGDAESIKRRIAEQTGQMLLAEHAALPSMTGQVAEIRNSIQYFASLPDRLPVAQITVTGGGSELHGMSELIAEQTGLPVLKVSPFDRIDVTPLNLNEEQVELVGSILSAPIGLALPEPDKNVKKFNLLPPEVAKRSMIKRVQKRVLVGCGAVVVLALAFGGWKALQVNNEQNNVNTIQSNISSLQAQIPRYNKVVAANNAYTAGLRRRASVVNTAIDWPLTLNNLVSITPSAASVVTFSGTSNSLTTPATPAPQSSTAPTAASIGSVVMGVTGPGPTLTISEAWINAVSSSPYVANPVQGATIVGSNNTIAFPFTVSITPAASLSKNASFK